MHSPNHPPRSIINAPVRATRTGTTNVHNQSVNVVRRACGFTSPHGQRKVCGGGNSFNVRCRPGDTMLAQIPPWPQYHRHRMEGWWRHKFEHLVPQCPSSPTMSEACSGLAVVTRRICSRLALFAQGGGGGGWGNAHVNHGMGRWC